MYTMTSDYEHITLDGSELKIEALKPFPTFAVKGEGIYVSFEPNIVAGDPGVRCTDDHDGSVILSHVSATDCIYVKGTGDIIVACYESDTAANSFKKSGKGGDSEGSLRMLGATTTALTDGATTNPITIDGKSVTAVKNDVAIYNTREFYFSGTTWSEFGGAMDTTPTSGSANAVTSDGIYRNTAGKKYYVNNAVTGETFNDSAHNVASGLASHAEGSYTTASGTFSHAEGNSTTASSAQAHAEGYLTEASGGYSHAGGWGTQATQQAMTAIGKYNDPQTGSLFEIGNGTQDDARSNILEVNSTRLNVNGDIQANGTSIITQYATMPTITADMVGRVVQYVGVSDSNYEQGWNYVAVSDGAAEPTYLWAALMDTTPTQGSANAVTSDGIYKRTPLARGNGSGSAVGGVNTTAQGNNSFAFGQNCIAKGTASIALGHNILARSSYGTNVGVYNVGSNNTLFEIGNGTGIARSNIVEVNSTELNVNGDIQKNGVSLPTPYTTMPTITADMVGRVVQYVGTTGNGFVKGYYYVASTDGAQEPTYSWTQVGGYKETVLYTNTTHADTPANTKIPLSDSFTNYDALCLISEYNDGTRNRLNPIIHLTNTIAVDNILTVNFDIGSSSNSFVSIVVTSENVMTVFGVSASNASHLQQIIGISFGDIKSAQPTQTKYTETVLWENDGTTNPASITLSSAYTNFDALILVGGNFGLADHVYMSTHVYPTIALDIANTTPIVGFGDDGAFTWYNVASTTSLTFRQGSLRIMKVIGVNY